MRRHIAGIVTIVSLVLAAVLWYWPLSSFPDAAGPCLRVAMLFGIVWLAYDEVQRLPGWLLLAVPVMLMILVFRPRWALVALPLILLLAILRPRSGAGRR